jgi:hypothetical protein
LPQTQRRLSGKIITIFPINEHWSLRANVFGHDAVGVLFHVVKSQAADREIDYFMTVPISRPV